GRGGGCGGGGRGGRGRWGRGACPVRPVRSPGEARPPVLVDRRRVLEIALVELLDEPGVGPEVLESGHAPIVARDAREAFLRIRSRCFASGRSDPARCEPGYPARERSLRGRFSAGAVRRSGRRGRATGARSGAGRTRSRTAGRGGRRAPPPSRRGTR